MMQEDPKDLFRHAGDFAAPEFVRSSSVHMKDEIDGTFVVCFAGLAKIGEDFASAGLELRRRCCDCCG